MKVTHKIPPCGKVVITPPTLFLPLFVTVKNRKSIDIPLVRRGSLDNKKHSSDLTLSTLLLVSVQGLSSPDYCYGQREILGHLSSRYSLRHCVSERTTSHTTMSVLTQVGENHTLGSFYRDGVDYSCTCRTLVERNIQSVGVGQRNGRVVKREIH